MSKDSRSLPKSAFLIPRLIYVVLQTLRYPKSGAPKADEGVEDLFNELEQDNTIKEASSEDLEVTVLNTFSTPDQANRCAGFTFLKHGDAHLEKGGKHGILRKENKSDMRNHLAALEDADQLFDKTRDLEGGRKIQVWVEQQVVSGPRN